MAMKQRHGKKAQRQRQRNVELRLRAALTDARIEVNTGRVLDRALRNLGQSEQYPDLLADLDAEMGRIIDDEGIKEIEQ